jgi:type I restriction-modification system DNA methylase subunit
MNLFLHGVEDFDVVRGDTLRQPAFHTGDSLAAFDCVIANPPFSLEKWGDDVWSSDPYGRNFAGLPPAKSGDYAWVQHMILSMAPKSGRMAVVLPHGALFRMGAEELLPEHVDRIYQWYAGHKDVVGVARLVPLDEIRQNDWNLNIPRYVEPVVEAETISVADAVTNLKTSLDAAYAVEDRLTQLLRESGLCE